MKDRMESTKVFVDKLVEDAYEAEQKFNNLVSKSNILLDDNFEAIGFEDKEGKRLYFQDYVKSLEQRNNAIIYSRLVMPKDLNPANRLFGGTMMSWIDEAGALFALKLTKGLPIVTVNISEINFKVPVKQGDLLEFSGKIKKAGRTSLTIDLKVNIPKHNEEDILVSECLITFVTINEEGNPIPHNLN